MRLGTKILVGGAIASVLVLLGGALNTVRLERSVEKLQSKCRANAVEDEKRSKAKGEWSPPASDLICDAKELTALPDLKGDQADIASASRDAQESRTWPRLLAVAVLCLSAVPWLWYFLLRRIAELRAAIGGNPPAG
jgi:hypothetical protein